MAPKKGYEDEARPVTTGSAAPPVDVVGSLSDLAQRPSVALALEAKEEFLGMDVAYTSEMVGDQTTLRAVEGEGGSFSISDGLVLPHHARV